MKETSTLFRLHAHPGHRLNMVATKLSRRTRTPTSKLHQKTEDFMPAYLLIVFAIVIRVAMAATPHPEWFNFSAVGGALLFFGARRSWREMLAPLVALMAADFYLTTYVYHYGFHWLDYLPTWAWYVAAMALGQILLRSRTTFVRVAAGALLGPTSFFILSDYAVWAAGTMYPKTIAGLGACFVAALPFYRNDLISTTIVAGLAFGVPVLIRRLNHEPQQQVQEALVQK
jgi:hypothetical protein